MQTKEKIVLDLATRDGNATVYAKQGDTARFVEVELTDHGVAVAIPEEATAFFRCRKPDGHSCYNPASIAEDRSHVLVELTDQALIVPGRVMADVVLTGQDGGVLSAFCFAIQVEAAPLGDLADSRDELKVYETQLQQLEEGLSAGGLTRATRIRITNIAGAEPPSVTLGVTYEDGSAMAYIINLDENGYPQTIVTTDGDGDTAECAVEWEGF